ncbi:ribosomal L7Ae/L30e/S12e/Gadd45 family protein [Staphylococcus sp. SQ8-PEA]|uniref:Ribosomal L7Ae/L30e/S12e/Gadd45 family protein n=1 Tax=Staphylococcus marylandisciuri TaxID=2981529 RepID=A0ABT2QRZ8_9STAP|nr:ribosomal L7Ae/L30e/S12e/Gadd45 family protein [Staphylococcus marylandisciuri]MCU5746749.1 ribosomal L7Ae/L30e/S12e/Gadd45 family protein [Staphylococcus marylandisciuri]
MRNNISQFLGLAMRAGKVKMGESVILSELKKKNIKLVIVASDASINTTQLMQNKCDSYQVDIRLYGTRSELGQALGKGERVNIGITDAGFAKKLLSMIDE